MTDSESPTPPAGWRLAAAAGLVLAGLAVGWIFGAVIDWPTAGQDQRPSPENLMCSALASLDPSLRQRFDEPDEPTLDLDDPDVWMMQAVPLLAQAEARTGSETDDELLESARNLQRAFTNANVAGVGTHLEMLEQRC